MTVEAVAQAASSPLDGPAAALGAAFMATLQTQWVVFVAVPLLVAVGAVFLRAFARHSFEIKPEDTVVGFDLGITACITLLISSLVLVGKPPPNVTYDPKSVGDYLAGIFIVLLIFIGSLVGVAAVFRKKGWSLVEGKANGVHKWWWRGVNGGGLVFLIIAFVVSGVNSK